MVVLVVSGQQPTLLPAVLQLTAQLENSAKKERRKTVQSECTVRKALLILMFALSASTVTQ